MLDRFFINAAVVFFVVSFSAMAGADETLSIKKTGGAAAEITNPYGDLWEYVENGNTWSLISSNNGNVVFKKGYDTLAEGKFKGGKLELKSASGDFFLKLKVTSEKVKINWNESDDLWELKQKKEKIKASRNGIGYGKIKFYKDTGKLKVKDRFEKIIAETRSFQGLSMVPGVYLMTDLSTDQQICLVLILSAKNR